MVVAADYELALREADRLFQSATTADDVRNTWRRYNSALGHRTLGRLLMGRSAEELLAKRAESDAET